MAGDRPDLMDEALGSGADAVVLDLADLVAPAVKAAARRNVAAFVRERPTGEDRPRLLVRVDPHHLDVDLDVVGDLPLDAICLPKANLDLVERVASSASSDVPVMALIETAVGLRQAAEVAEHPSVRNLACGEAALSAELGIDPKRADAALWPLRMQLVVASAAAGIDPPSGPVPVDPTDPDALRADTEALEAAGFGSRQVVRPDQVGVIAAVFRPTAAERDAALALVTAFDDAITRGEGILVDDHGRMVDLAVVRHARRILADSAPATYPPAP